MVAWIEVGTVAAVDGGAGPAAAVAIGYVQAVGEPKVGGVVAIIDAVSLAQLPLLVVARAG